MSSRKPILQGDSYTLIVRVKDEGLVRSISGIKSVEYKIYKKIGGEVVHTGVLGGGISIPDPTTGLILIDFPWEVTDRFVGQLYHRCRIIDESDRRITLFGNHFDVVAEKFQLGE